MTDPKLIETVARAISPHGWNDDYWQDTRHIGQYDRNQRHCQENARKAAALALAAINASGTHWLAPITIYDFDEVILAMREKYREGPSEEHREFSFMGELFDVMRTAYLAKTETTP